MIARVTTTHTRRLAPRKLVQGALALALGVCACTTPALAGKAGAAFQVKVNFQPGPGTCRATIGPDGRPRVDCGPSVIGPGTPGGPQGDLEGALGYRLPDARMKLANAIVEVGEESFFAWGEYSSRLMLAGEVEYVEMTVTW